jgi:hypothetical protein
MNAEEILYFQKRMAEAAEAHDFDYEPMKTVEPALRRFTQIRDETSTTFNQILIQWSNKRLAECYQRALDGHKQKQYVATSRTLLKKRIWKASGD